MAKQTDIQWTDHTWNPWQGCKKVSPGCKNCYMFRDKKRFGQDPENIHKSGNVTFFAPSNWEEPAKVFTCSWSDFFLEEADLWRDDAWAIIRSTPHLTYQILTKRPERMRDHLPNDWPLDNVWLGVTVETQREDHRIIDLLNIPAKKRFISVEPMIGPVNLLPLWARKLDWVICGGESGAGFRKMEKCWAADLSRDCMSADLPFFMKQMAGVRPKKISIPDHLNIKEFPK